MRSGICEGEKLEEFSTDGFGVFKDYLNFTIKCQVDEPRRELTVISVAAFERKVLHASTTDGDIPRAFSNPRLEKMHIRLVTHREILRSHVSKIMSHTNYNYRE